MGSEARVDEVRPAIEDRLGGEAHLTTALPGMLEVLSSQLMLSLDASFISNAARQSRPHIRRTLALSPASQVHDHGVNLSMVLKHSLV